MKSRRKSALAKKQKLCVVRANLLVSKRSAKVCYQARHLAHARSCRAAIFCRVLPIQIYRRGDLFRYPPCLFGKWLIPWIYRSSCINCKRVAATGISGVKKFRAELSNELAIKLTGRKRHGLRCFASVLSISVGLLLGACQTSEITNVTNVDKEQGSAANIESLTMVVNRNPNDAEAYNVRGAAYGRAGNSAKALKDFNRAIQLNSRYYQAFANRALIFRQMGERAQAAKDYNTALGINPQYAPAYIGRGNIFRAVGKINQAFEDYSRAIQLDTTDPRAYHNRGLIYQNRRNHEFAIEDFSTAISLADKAPAPYNARGVSYLAVGAERNALDDFNTALKLNSRYAEAWSNQALVLERRGEKMRAFKSYARAISLKPGYGPAMAGMKRTRGS